MGFIKTIKSAMEKLLHPWECNETYSIALSRNGKFYLISCDHKQPIKRPEFNEVYNIKWIPYNRKRRRAGTGKPKAYPPSKSDALKWVNYVHRRLI